MGKQVESLCESVFEALSRASTAAGSASVGAADDSADVPAAPADCKTTAADVVRRAALELDARLKLADDIVEHLAATLQALPDEDVLEPARLALLVEPFLLDAFHELGEWTSEEDLGKAEQFSASVALGIRALR